jgi:hypothetical protein
VGVPFCGGGVGYVVKTVQIFHKSLFTPKEYDVGNIYMKTSEYVRVMLFFFSN